MQIVQDGEELRWIKPKRSKLQFELHTGEAVVATLVWARGSRAIGQWAQDQYQFNREGWFRPRVLVRRASSAAADVSDDQGEVIATFAHPGTLSFVDGRAFLWKKPKRWTNERIWTDVNATEIVRFRQNGGGSATTVTTQPAFTSTSELALLVLLGQYMLVLASQDAAAASSAAAVAVITSG